MSHTSSVQNSITVHLPDVPETKWERERRAFLRLHPELLRTHRNKYVAIHEGQVVDADDALVPLARRVYTRHGHVPIYMDLVTDEPRRVERIPTPRVSQLEPPQ